MNKKPVCFFAVGSREYSKYAIPFWKSMTKFHSPKDIDMLWYTNEKSSEVLKKLPVGIKLMDLDPLLIDPAFYFRQKPVIAETLMDEYELVCGFDTDQIILGSLDYIIKTTDYDVGTVYNWNRHDQQFYPMVEMMRIGIVPAEYFNCSLVAMRSKKFVHTWLVWCFSPSFDRCQYREQDGLNILAYSGNWNVRCFDLPDMPNKHFGWYGLIGKMEWARSELRGKDIVVPKGFGSTPFPPADVQIHAATLGGGHGAVKDNWANYFPPKVMERINEIIA